MFQSPNFRRYLDLGSIEIPAYYNSPEWLQKFWRECGWNFDGFSAEEKTSPRDQLPAGKCVRVQVMEPKSLNLTYSDIVKEFDEEQVLWTGLSGLVLLYKDRHCIVPDWMRVISFSNHVSPSNIAMSLNGPLSVTPDESKDCLGRVFLPDMIVWTQQLIKPNELLLCITQG